MTTTRRWITADLETFPTPPDDTRYEIIDGELYVSKQPSLEHQYACSQINAALTVWSRQTGLGYTLIAPGVIFADDDNVAPDIVWISKERLRTAARPDGKLHEAPELVVEVLSPGAMNEQRDRDAKLKLYSRRGVLEYWMFDYRRRRFEVYRRHPDEPTLQLAATVEASEQLQSSLLPGFSLQVGELILPEA